MLTTQFDMATPETIPFSRIRAAARCALLLAASALLLPICGLPILVAGLFGARARFAVVLFLTPFFCRVMAWCVGLRTSIVGRRSRTALVFVGNHVTYLDILVAGIGVGGVFVSRHDVKDWPVIGIFARLAGTVFLDRSSLRSAVASSAGLAERAGQGIRVAFFPEGRTSAGERVAEFRPFLFSAVAASSISVQPFSIRYTHIGRARITDANNTLIYWYDPAPPFTTHGWRILGMRNVRATITFGEELPAPAAADKESVRAYAEELHRRVSEGFDKCRT